MNRWIRVFLFFMAFAFSAGGLMPVHMAAAQGGAGPIIIRDTEIENILKEWIRPLLPSAGIDSNNLDIIIVQDPQINAFVAGGANIFIYTGLIQKTKNPGELLGVMGHELGHIAGGHLIAARMAMERATYESMLGSILGMGAAALGGNSGAGGAVIYGSQNMAQRRLFSHTRTNESSADQAALRFFEGANLNPEGIVSFFGTLESEELLPVDQQSEYMRTHPLTRNRMDAVRGRAEKSPYYGAVYPEGWERDYALIKAKLLGFINPTSVVWTYNDKDHSVPAMYARAIAAYRTNKIDDALSIMDELLQKEPDNPYFEELKGQMLVDFGRVSEAIPYYRRAAEGAPNSALIRMALARALLELPFAEKNALEAIDQLKLAEKGEPRSGHLHRLMATAYGKLGNDVEARLHLAEEAVLQGRYDYARSQADFVVKNASSGSRTRLQAQDILAYLEQKVPQKR